MSAALEGNKRGNYQGIVSAVPNAVTVNPMHYLINHQRAQNLPQLWLTPHLSQEIFTYAQRSQCLRSHQFQAYFESMV